MAISLCGRATVFSSSASTSPSSAACKAHVCSHRAPTHISPKRQRGPASTLAGASGLCASIIPGESAPHNPSFRLWDLGFGIFAKSGLPSERDNRYTPPPTGGRYGQGSPGFRQHGGDRVRRLLDIMLRRLPV